MNIFIDANILISVLNKEYPSFTYTSRILSLVNNSRFKIFTSPLCLAIAFYFAEKKNKKTARQKINLLIAHLSVTTVNAAVVDEVKNNKSIHDFEDGLQYYSALVHQCDCIITQDTDDFYFSEIPVWDPALFIKNTFQQQLSRKNK